MDREHRTEWDYVHPPRKDLGETMAAVLAEEAADLPKRRASVMAEVLSRVKEEADRIENRFEATEPYRTKSINDVESIEEYFIERTAETLNVVVRMAMQRGAGGKE